MARKKYFNAQKQNKDFETAEILNVFIDGMKNTTKEDEKEIKIPRNKEKILKQ